VRHYDGSRFWNFADIGETSERLHKAGFREIAVRLVPDEARLEDRAQLEAFVATVVLAAPLREMPSDQRAAFVTDVCDRLPEPAIDFVRLQIEATRATTTTADSPTRSL
jgi:trans-aconitate 2-methyltransferase